MTPDEIELFKRQIVQIANLGIYQIVTGKIMSKPLTPVVTNRWNEKPGLFITLRKEGKIRGSMGMLETSQSLQESLFEIGGTAATHDGRYPAVQPNELEAIETEIAILNKFTSIKALDEITVGTHGLIISRGEKRAVLLPSVAAEYSWTAEQFLEACCEKAGLSHKAWRDDNTLVETFTCETFKSGPLIESISEYITRSIKLH